MIRHFAIVIATVTLLGLGALIPASSHAERLPFAKPGPDSAQVNGAPGVRAQDIYAVEFIAIDGRNIPPRQTLWLQPGEYELTVRVLATQTRHNLMWRTRGEDGYNRITVELEPGKTYDIRALFERSDRRSPYSVVVHNVSE